MSLRRQLLLVSLLLLTLPWAGCQFIREMEGALRQGQAQALSATARAVASGLSDPANLLYPQPGRLGAAPDDRVHIFAKSQKEPIILDGYGDGWGEQPHYTFSGESGALPLVASYQAVTRGEMLYLWLKVQDARVSYQDPTIGREPNGDRLVLRTWLEDRRQEYVISPIAPGRVVASHGGRILRGTDPRQIQGFWQDTRDGYSLELQIPIRMTGGRLGFYLVNVDSGRGGKVSTLGNITPLETRAPPWLIYSPPALAQAMSGFARLGEALTVVDAEAWQIASLSGSTPGYGAAQAETFWALRTLYRRALRREVRPSLPLEAETGRLAGEELEEALLGEAAVRWYRDPNRQGYALLSAAAPISNDERTLGAVIVRSSSAQYLSLADQAFGTLLGYSLAALALTVLGLLGYASLLSWRIHRLSRAADRAIDEDGAVRNSFPRSRAHDEIGHLSRQYGALLDRVRGYNDYLRGLSRKLSHELRTPIAVIRSSLDNLEHGETQDHPIYVERAKSGLQRLSGILGAMAEASQLEDSIRNNPLRPCELVGLVTELSQAYRSLYTQHKVSSDLPPLATWANASPELLAQALDKLMENAASFCPSGGEIRLKLQADAELCVLSVENEGPPLPATTASELLEPMVSLREGSDAGQDELHMGLGLHIARLIAEYHEGTLRGENLAGGDGVRFTLRLPLTNGAPAGAPR
ncbi:MAG: ATP-binding protein [Pseudomonadota bacterium]